MDTSDGGAPTDSPPSSTGTEETVDEGGVPDEDYEYTFAKGERRDTIDFEQDRGNIWEGNAPRGDPLLLPGENGDVPDAGGGPAAAAAALEARSGIPIWAWGLGAIAAGFALYKFGGKKR